MNDLSLEAELARRHFTIAELGRGFTLEKGSAADAKRELEIWKWKDVVSVVWSKLVFQQENKLLAAGLDPKQNTLSNTPILSTTS